MFIYTHGSNMHKVGGKNRRKLTVCRDKSTETISLSHFANVCGGGSAATYPSNSNL